MLASIKYLIQITLDDILKKIISDLRLEIDNQGHNATGSLSESLKYNISESDSNGFLGVIFGNDYWLHLEDGVKASRIKYTPGRGRGGRSRYIDKLLGWAEVVRPELDEKERKSFVFAVATKHSIEGNPTRKSYYFSKNGERKHFVSRIIEKHIKIIELKLSKIDLAPLVLKEFLRAA